MTDKEKIPVYIDIRNGKTICVCHAARRGCGRKGCVRDEVTRDKFDHWKDTMKRNRYGK